MNADDFGLSEGVNRGIADSWRNGILRSASLMPNGEAFTDAVSIARGASGLGVGIHISLVGERCVAPPVRLGRLVDAGGRLPASYLEFTRGYFSRSFTTREIRREVVAQMGRLLDAGIRPTHIDSHQHIHLLPAVFDIVVEAALATGIPVIRVPHERNEPGTWRFNPRNVQLQILSILCRFARRRARAAGLRVVQHFYGLSSSGAMDEPTLLRVLKNVCPGVNEVMTHPGRADDALRRKYRWNYNWDLEAAALQSLAVRQLVEERRIRLTHFGEAWRGE